MNIGGEHVLLELPLVFWGLRLSEQPTHINADQPPTQSADDARLDSRDAGLAGLSFAFALLYLVAIFASCCTGWFLTIQGIRREEPLWPHGSSLRGAEDIALLAVIVIPTYAAPLLFLAISLTYAVIAITYWCWAFAPKSNRTVTTGRQEDRRWLVAFGALLLFVASMVMFGFAHYRIYHPFNGIRPEAVPFQDDPFTANFIITLAILGFISLVSGLCMAFFSIIDLFVSMRRPL